jgi:multiple antibiotic resistance protein
VRGAEFVAMISVLLKRLPAVACGALAASAAFLLPAVGLADPLAGIPRLTIGPGQIFTFLFIMVGPLNVLGPFAQVTAHADRPLRRRIAIATFAIALLALLAGAYLGTILMKKWQISIAALTLAGGIILFLVALKKILAPDPPEKLAAVGEHPTMRLALSPLAFPTITTPYGVATLIIFLVLGPEMQWTIIGMLALVLVLDLLAMLFARRILHTLGVPLQVLGAVLGVLQAALGIQVILLGIRRIIIGG